MTAEAAARAEPTIFINGRFLEQPLSGVQRYAREMLAALDRLLSAGDSRDERWCLLTTGNETDCPPLQAIQKRTVRSSLRGHAWEQFALGRAARSGALIGFGGSGPLLHPRQLVVIHDGSVFRHPEFYSARYRLWHRMMGRLLARRARIATVSEFSRSELADVLHLDAGDIPVFTNGSEHLDRVAPNAEALDRLGLRGRTYFVTLGNLTPNKNLSVALKALEQVPEALLVVVGSVNERVFASGAAERFGDRLVFAGRLDDASVSGLLGNAAALLFSSLYEGFGIPPLEAMVNDCPVIASDIPPVREVCRDAALYFDPHDAEQLAAAMRTVLSEPAAARRERIRKGAERAAAFTWDRSARRLAEYCRRELLRL
jgi:glycosyltransferase involved in cell wall biosynthesis